MINQVLARFDLTYEDLQMTSMICLVGRGDYGLAVFDASGQLIFVGRDLLVQPS